MSRPVVSEFTRIGSSVLKPAAARYVAYLAYIGLRLWRMKHDVQFPLWDGWTYYAKAIYLAEAPRARLFSSEAFSVFSVRPPGPMWLTFPFVWVAPVFSVFALGLLIWTVVGVEWGVRSAIPERRPWVRLWAAVLIIAGVGPLYHGFELFYVDGLLAGMAVAALGCAIGWLRRARLPFAMAGGCWLFLAILTKPAGFVVSASVAAVLVVGWILKVWRKPSHLRFSRAPVRFWFAVVCWSVPVFAGFLAFVSTPYSAMWELGGAAFAGATLCRLDLVTPWNVTGAANYLRMASRVVGSPVLLVSVLMTGAALFSLWRRGSRLRPLATAGVFGAMVVAVFVYSLPSRQLRFFAPVAAMGFLAISISVSFAWPRFSRSLLALFAAIVVLFRVVTLGGFLPDSPWTERPLPFSFPMQGLREDLALVDRALRESKTADPPVILATDVVDLFESLKLVEWLRGNVPERAACQLPPYVPFRLASPPWPYFEAKALAHFPFAQVLIVRCPTGEEQPAGSSSRDWQTVNRALWNADTPLRLGWKEVARREWYAVYVNVTSEAEPVEVQQRRIDFLASLDLASPSARETLDALRSRSNR